MKNSYSDTVPEGRQTLARQFIAGKATTNRRVPAGRLKRMPIRDSIVPLGRALYVSVPGDELPG